MGGEERGGDGEGRAEERRGGEERAGEGLPRLEITSGYALGCGGRGWAAAQKITFVSKMITFKCILMQFLTARSI